jgi:hypothetical protein
VLSLCGLAPVRKASCARLPCGPTALWTACCASAAKDI